MTNFPAKRVAKKQVRSEITRACLYRRCTLCFVICPCKCHDDERSQSDDHAGNGIERQGELFSS